MDIPSIGVGKTVFAVDGITQDGVAALCEKYLGRGGDVIELIGKSGKVWGAALKSTDREKEPVIISQGHRVSLKTSIKIVKDCIYKFRIPEPVI
jgi:deoxyinosine 3'endonuclease (endonuclease V)